MSHSTSLKYVDHTYRDFSRYVEEGGQLIKHKKCHKNFPAKVHRILSDSENSHVITWMVRTVWQTSKGTTQSLYSTHMRCCFALISRTAVQSKFSIKISSLNQWFQNILFVNSLSHSLVSWMGGASSGCINWALVSCCGGNVILPSRPPRLVNLPLRYQRAIDDRLCLSGSMSLDVMSSSLLHSTAKAVRSAQLSALCTRNRCRHSPPLSICLSLAHQPVFRSWLLLPWMFLEGKVKFDNND